MVGATWTTVCQTVRTLGIVQGDGVIHIPDDRLYIVIPLTPWIERRKSIGMRKSLIIDNYLTGIRISEPTGTPLNDAGHLNACSWFGFAQEEQGVPAGAFMIVRRRFVTAPEFLNAQMGNNLYGFDPYSLAHFHMTWTRQHMLQ